jgi:lipopolysaccharide/colanic/teichoic acid biosynthesis glycosyltransferase
MGEPGEIPLGMVNFFPLWKRFFDIIFSLVVIGLTFPLWFILSVLIKLEDKGPLFYKHPRVGENGRNFNCLKFRSMYVDADKKLHEILDSNPTMRKEWEESFKLKHDPRITRMGRFLRKTSLDELPNFINVFLGEMSVVGARPIVLEELKKYYKDSALHYCAMKPGITGLWQVGKRSDIKNYQERVKLDEWYVLNTSVWLDLKIIFKTAIKMFFGKGAY